MATVPQDLGNPPVSLITFKQVREVENPTQRFQSLACYQAIVESKMQVDSLKDGGLLIDAVSPDSSGGIYVDIWAENPDVLKLGIMSQEVDTGKDDWGKVRRVRPILPFWIKMDLSYGLADYQVWRTNLTSWTSNNTPQLRTLPKNLTYIDLDSGATQEIAPPRFFPAVTQRILPLQAETAALDRLLAGYLDNDHYQFKSIGKLGDKGVVCLILSNFDKMQTAERDATNIDSQAGYRDYELTFAIPARWTRTIDKAFGDCLIPAYSFVGTYWNSITTSEVYGRVAFKSTFVDPPFFANLPPEKGDINYRPENLGVTLMTDIFPSEDRTQPLKHLPLLQIYSVYAQDKPSRAVLQQPKQTVEEFVSGIGLSAYCSIEKRIHSIALKQIRDANDPTKADYQSYVLLEQNLVESALAYFDPQLHVRIYDYPGFPLIETLGLIVDQKDNDSKTSLLTAHDSFYMRGRIECGPPINIWWRIGKNTSLANPRFKTGVASA
jgi:hypothetical protein